LMRAGLSINASTRFEDTRRRYALVVVTSGASFAIEVGVPDHALTEAIDEGS
jgi:hypothetical protein